MVPCGIFTYLYVKLASLQDAWCARATLCVSVTFWTFTTIDDDAVLSGNECQMFRCGKSLKL